MPHQKLRVMIVEDHADTAEMLATLATHWGYDTRTASTGAEALRVFDEFHPTVSLLDLKLPDQSGYDLAVQLRQRGERVFLVVVTGMQAVVDQQRSAAAGISHHLVKPVNPDTLKRILGGYQLAEELRRPSSAPN